MAINPQDTMTYGELLDAIITWIPSICKNIDAYDSSVHASVRPNYSVNTVSQKWDWEYRHSANAGATHYRTTFNCTMNTRASTIIPVVTQAILSSDLNTFLSQRNLIQRRDGIVTTSGLLNLWNNIACFLYKHLVGVTSNLISETYLMYWSNSPYSYATVTNMTDLNLTPKETCISALDINELLGTLQETFNPVWRTHVITYTQTLSDSTIKMEECAAGTYPTSGSGRYIPDYTIDQVLLEENNPGTFNFYIDAKANYQIICVGGGGGGSSSRFNDQGTGACGGSGGYSNETVILSPGTYTVTVGYGGQATISQNDYAQANNGGDTSFGPVIATGGKGAVSNHNEEYAYGGKGGTGTTQNGNNGITESSSYTPSVHEGYGKGGYGYNADAVAGTSGYIKVIYKGQ